MKTGAGLWVRAELRRHWPALLLLAALCGVVVAVVLTAVAGARRTTTAYDRYLDEGGAGHAEVLMMAGLRGRTDFDLGNGKSADDLATRSTGHACSTAGFLEDRTRWRSAAEPLTSWTSGSATQSSCKDRTSAVRALLSRGRHLSASGGA